jgi:hypothetical protein
MTGDLLVFLGLAALLGAAGIAVGMLVIAPRLTRLADRTEEPGDRTDD